MPYSVKYTLYFKDGRKNVLYAENLVKALEQIGHPDPQTIDIIRTGEETGDTLVWVEGAWYKKVNKNGKKSI